MHLSARTIASLCWVLMHLKGAHLNGQVFMSDCTDGSSIFRPIKRFASKTVFLGLIATCASMPVCERGHANHCGSGDAQASDS